MHRYPTTRENADRALAIYRKVMKSGSYAPLAERSHDACYENNDGDAVCSLIIASLHDDWPLARAMTKWPLSDYAPRVITRAALEIVRNAPNREVVKLLDGEALQGLIPGVAPVSITRRAMAALQASRAARRSHAAPPAGGLFDDVARAQGSLL